jgi:hypothetical protein
MGLLLSKLVASKKMELIIPYGAGYIYASEGYKIGQKSNDYQVSTSTME